MELAHNTFEDVLRNMISIKIPQGDPKSDEQNMFKVNDATTNGLHVGSITKITKPTLTNVKEYWEAKTEDFNDKVQEIKKTFRYSGPYTYNSSQYRYSQYKIDYS